MSAYVKYKFSIMDFIAPLQENGVSRNWKSELLEKGTFTYEKENINVPSGVQDNMAIRQWEKQVFDINWVRSLMENEEHKWLWQVERIKWL